MEFLYNSIRKKMITGQGPKIWVLNIKYCSQSMIGKNEIRVEYSYEETIGAKPFSLDAIRDIDKCNFAVFKKSYLDERAEILDRDAQDMRILAIWSFYKNIKQGDIVLLVSGASVFCYYIVTGGHIEIEDKEDSCEHFWQAELHDFDKIIEIKDRFGSPFFKTLDGKLGDQIVSVIKSRINL